MADFFLVLFLTGPRLISKMRFLIFDSVIDEIREQTRVRGNVPTQSWWGKSAVFRIYCALTFDGSSNNI
jgi:hypothetical protein